MMRLTRRRNVAGAAVAGLLAAIIGMQVSAKAGPGFERGDQMNVEAKGGLGVTFRPPTAGAVPQIPAEQAASRAREAVAGMGVADDAIPTVTLTRFNDSMIGRGASLAWKVAYPDQPPLMIGASSLMSPELKEMLKAQRLPVVVVIDASSGEVIETFQSK